MAKLLPCICAFLLLCVSLPASAQRGPEFEIHLHELHAACDHGDRGACVRFGMLLGEHRELHEEWRRTHPEWFWWDR